MYGFTPNASCTTIDRAPSRLGRPGLEARHRPVGGRQLDRPRRDAFGHARLSSCRHDASRPARSDATNAPASSGPPPVEQPAHERAADDHAVGGGRGLGGLLRVRDARAPSSTGLSVAALQRRPITFAWLGEVIALPRHAHQRDAVHEAAGPLADRARAARRPVVGPASSTVSMPAASAASPHPSSSSSGRSGTIARVDATRDQRGGEALVAHVLDRVVVRHHDERDVDVEAGEVRRDARGRRTDVQRALRRLLDRAAVHHRVRERDADLDRVGAGGGDRAHDVEPGRARARRSRTARAACCPASRSARSVDSRFTRAAPRSAAPRPASRPCRRGPTASRARSSPAGSLVPTSRASQPIACAGSSAGHDALGPAEQLEARRAPPRRWPSRTSARPDAASVGVLGPDARVVEPGADRVRLEDLAVLVLEEQRAGAVQHARARPGSATRRACPTRARGRRPRRR